MVASSKILKLAAVKRVESAAGQARYKKSIGAVITGGESAPTSAPPKQKSTKELPANGGLTGAEAAEYQNVLKRVRSALSSGSYDAGAKKLLDAIQILKKSNGDARTVFVLERALIRLERTVSGNVNK